MLNPLVRAFANLRVRAKLIVLHNLFFLVLSGAVYAAVSAGMSARSKWALAAALGAVYVLAVLFLELAIMPGYVYRPLRRLLDADRATQRGDTARELIDPALIANDELGQIMRSRNATIAELRSVAEDLRRKNEMLETARRSLAAQDRLVSLGLLSAGVAHELNTPLAVLEGSLEKLLETVQDPPTRQRLERMQRVTGRLRTISESLLDFARVRTPEMRPVELAPIIGEAWLLVSIDEKAAGVTFRPDIPSGELVLGDSDRLVQIFVNLLRNALNAVTSSGTIEAGSRRLTAAGREWVAIAIDDDGPGIPADVLPHVFEAFVTSRLDARGTGLGLTVAQGIVEQHGGSIEASNRPGGGARLEVRLPAGGPA
ncbi:MAG TPA: HAMP domain-containing sensor histidine kinase [Bryobacteraceae bacterium]|nr:HAMP domain-containing sensor histidine kinase [Bryobacteraceae bacterium]